MGVEASVPLPNPTTTVVSNSTVIGGNNNENQNKQTTTNSNVSSSINNIKTAIIPPNQPLRVLIRGVRGVGKTTLSKRLKGGSFITQYIPSPEISTFHINWQIGEEKAKIEVWDVVDEGFIKPSQDHPGKKSSLVLSELATDKVKADAILKGSVSSGSHKIGAFDASVVDLYKGAHAVIFLISPFDLESLKYVESLYKDIPLHINILLILSFRDKVTRFHDDPSIDDNNVLKKTKKSKKKKNSFITANERKGNYESDDENDDVEHESFQIVTFDAVLELLSDIRDWRIDHDDNNKEGYKNLGESVHAIEISNLNCFGLKELHQYIMLPYLRFKRASILEYAEQMRKMINKLGDEIYTQSISDTNTYAPFMKKYNSRMKASSADKSANKTNTKMEGNDVHSSIEDNNNRKNDSGDDDDESGDNHNNNDDDDDDDEEEMIREREKAKARVKEEARKARKINSKGDNNPQGKSISESNDTNSGLKLENKTPVKKPIIEDDYPDQDNSDDIFAYRPNVGNKALTAFLGSSDEEEKPSKVIEKKSKVKKSKFDEPTLPTPSNYGKKASGLQRVGRKSKTTKANTEDTEPEKVSSTITNKSIEIAKSEVINSTITDKPTATVTSFKKVDDVKINEVGDEYHVKKEQVSLSIPKKKDDSLAAFLDDSDEESTMKNSKPKIESKSIVDSKNDTEMQLQSSKAKSYENHNVNVSKASDNEEKFQDKVNGDKFQDKVNEDKEEEIIKIPGTLRRPRKNKNEEKSKSSIDTASVVLNHDNDDEDEGKVKIQSVLRRPRKVKIMETIETIESDQVQSLDQIELPKIETLEKSLITEKESYISSNDNTAIEGNISVTIDSKSIEPNDVSEAVVTAVENKELIIESNDLNSNVVNGNSVTSEVNELNNVIATLSIDNLVEIENNIEVEDHVEIKGHLESGDHLEIANIIDVKKNTEVEDHAEVENNMEVENNVEFENNTEIENKIEIEDNIEIVDNSEIGNSIDVEKITDVENNMEILNQSELQDQMEIKNKIEVDNIDNATEVKYNNVIEQINTISIESKESIDEDLVSSSLSSSSSLMISRHTINEKIKLVDEIKDELESFVANDEDDIFDEGDSYISKPNTIDTIKILDKIENIPTTKVIKKKSTISSKNNFNDDDDDDDDNDNIGIGIKSKTFKDIEEYENDEKIDFKNLIINSNKDKGNTASLNNAISQIMSSFQQQIVIDDNNVDNNDKKKKKEKKKKAKKEKKEKKKKSKIQSDEDEDLNDNEDDNGDDDNDF